MFAGSALFRIMDNVDGSPWGASAGRHLDRLQGSGTASLHRSKSVKPLYTADQKRLRDTTGWTKVQGLLAPIQFFVFLVSIGLVCRFLLTGQGEQAATWSILAKTGCLYAIMVTGAIWEKVVFGKYLFAPVFFWEDAVSMLVVALHTFYVGLLLSGSVDNRHLMLLALVAYAAYFLNATQFVLKLRAARRLEGYTWPTAHGLRHV